MLQSITETSIVNSNSLKKYAISCIELILVRLVDSLTDSVYFKT